MRGSGAGNQVVQTMLTLIAGILAVLAVRTSTSRMLEKGGLLSALGGTEGII